MVIGNNHQINNASRLVQTGKPANSAINGRTLSDKSFDEILRNSITGGQALKLSKHAEQRLRERDIMLTGAQQDRLLQALSIADGKGVKDPLVIMDDIAFVVNVKNRTVVTAIHGNELKKNVFTNIDGAVFI